METLAERYWIDFESEVVDHLDGIESGLGAFVEGQVETSVGTVFRALHSIKGLARAMGLTGMETSAHAAESVLQFVRDKGAPATPDIIDALFAAQDMLRRQLATAIQRRDDQPADPGVMSALNTLERTLSEQFEEDGATPEEADAVPADEGTEMMKLFGELLKMSVERLAALLDSNEAECREDALEALSEVINAAEVMELPALQETVARLAELLTDGFPGSSEPRRTPVLRVLTELIGNIKVIEEIAEVEGIAAGLTTAAEERLAADVSGALVQLSEKAEDMVGTLAGGFPVSARALTAFLALVERVEDLLVCVGFDHGAEVLALLKDFCAGLEGRIDTDLSNELSAVADVVEAVRRSPRLSQSQHESLAGILRYRLVGKDSSVPDGLINGIEVGADMRAVLNASDVELLAAYLGSGEHAYRWSLYLEDSQDIASSIVTWISRNAHPIHSRTVLRGEKSWFEFLLTTTLRPDELPVLLTRLDPGGLCIKKVTLLDSSPGGQVVFEETAAGAVSKDPEILAAQGGGTDARFLRVRSDAIDRLIEAIGALRSRVSDIAEVLQPQLCSASRDAAGGSRLASDPRDDHLDLLNAVQRAAEAIETDVYNLHVVPLQTVFSRLPRVVHALSRQQDKHVQLVLDDGNIRIDKATLDVLLEPLVHLINNAIDHGIEPSAKRRDVGKPDNALITVAARKAGAELILTITDDGRGMDEAAILRTAIERRVIDKGQSYLMTPKEVLRLTLQPGFSTASALTTVSGRGVGLDVVATTIRKLDGSIDIDSTPGKGTTFRLRLPLMRSQQAVVMVETAGQIFALNERAVIRVAFAEIRPSDEGCFLMQTASGSEIKAIPLLELLWLPRKRDNAIDAAERSIVIIGTETEALGLIVDKVLERRSVSLRNTNKILSASRVISGAATLVDGRIAMVLDTTELLSIARTSRWRDAPAPIYAT